jgi:hypothetical protein
LLFRSLFAYGAAVAIADIDRVVRGKRSKAFTQKKLQGRHC